MNTMDSQVPRDDRSHAFPRRRADHGPGRPRRGLSTELEARGHDVSSALWSARLLRDDPAAIVAAHAAFAAAGAQVATTASYQATVGGFAATGVDAGEARRLIASSVALAREGQGPGWVAGSVGPYGAMLADGSEYTGAYVAEVGIAELRAFHRPRMELLAEAGADVLACETVPAAAEAEALLTEAEALGVPIWLSLTTVVDDAGLARTRRGERAADVLAMAADVDAVVAVGVNCTAPSAVAPSLAAAALASRPVVVYPNSGETWDAAARRWAGSPGILPDDVPGWVSAGGRLIGGCCRVRPAHIRAVASEVELLSRS
ncbi:homocysteine S-methyltransferase [Blastococcus brunescens]|uniref:Homocysteine S-methyltransferase n=1 Tax=Blastococcus brunescens TaxID=1564165 RepID=A0ABZ1B9Y1_9ACTN|nr:homocysteine S-methyltransferase [Blastococcus sp. BMG 8361]WRL66274.1 homocysteine S-methyltransferase [Blastococcus sp. BMG 8361]